MRREPLVLGLLASTALASITAAYAQAPGASILEEVEVTATRQTSTVNKVPMAMSAVSQRTLEEQGVKNVEDLARTVPGVTFRRSGGEGNPNVTIRGIGGNAATVGSPTTGVYLDDSALQRRNINGLITGNGSPFPQLFDLERVEVLRGPQGTLYGGSSQGGTIRFITPTPSLTTYSGQARLETSQVEGGGTNYEGGAAFGGPIVDGVLGFRASAYYARTAGWVDSKSLYDGHEFATDINSGNQSSFRGSLLWQASDKLQVTPALYVSREYSQDGAGFRMPTNAYTVPAYAFTNAGTINGVRYDFPDTALAATNVHAMPWYGKNITQNGRYLSTTNVRYEASPRATTLILPNVNLEYEFDSFIAKAITTYVKDRTVGTTYTGGGVVRTNLLPNPSGTGATLQFIPGFSDTNSYYNYINDRDAWSEELRFSSKANGQRLSWVGGLFLSDSRIYMHGSQNANEMMASQFLHGAQEGWFLGANPLPTDRVLGNPILDDVSDREVTLREREIAGFGELTFDITDKLKAIGGIRYTSYKQTFNQVYGGAVAGAPGVGVSIANPGGFIGAPLFSSTGTIVTNPNLMTAFPNDLAGCPTSANCPLQYTRLKSSEKPVSPKLGLSYQATADYLFYGTYSKGFRPGGVNPPVPPVQCASDLAALGISAVQETYTSDTVSSYELGSKLRLFQGRAQINASVFKINWKDIQYNLPLRGCGFAYLTNAADATSEGFDVQATTKLWDDLTLNANIAYTDAKFSKTLQGPPNSAGARALLANKGDNLGIPDWNVAVGAQYDFAVANYKSYVRADYQYTGTYMRTTGVGTTSYDAILNHGETTATINARAGVNIDAYDLSLFVQNLTNSDEFINKGHGTRSAVVTGTTFRPRTIGLQLRMKF